MELEMLLLEASWPSRFVVFTLSLLSFYVPGVGKESWDHGEVWQLGSRSLHQGLTLFLLSCNWCLKMSFNSQRSGCTMPDTCDFQAWGRSLAQTIKVPVRFSVKDQKVNICCGSIWGSYSELFLSCPEQYLESNEKWQELTNKSD